MGYVNLDDGSSLELSDDDYLKFRKSMCSPRWYMAYWECELCQKIFIEGEFHIDTTCCNHRRFKKLAKPFWSIEEYNQFLVEHGLGNEKIEENEIEEI